MPNHPVFAGKQAGFEFHPQVGAVIVIDDRVADLHGPSIRSGDLNSVLTLTPKEFLRKPDVYPSRGL